MAVREIRLFGDPVLSSPCDEVLRFDSATAALAADLTDTTRLPGRAGVAAPQIGVGLRAFAYNVDGRVGVLFNPRLVELAGLLRPVSEGCLSLPGLWHEVPRYEFARVSGQDATGQPIELSGRGLMAQMLQHECDHLEGKLYIDRLPQDSRRQALRELRESDWFGRD